MTRKQPVRPLPARNMRSTPARRGSAEKRPVPGPRRVGGGGRAVACGVPPSPRQTMMGSISVRVSSNSDWQQQLHQVIAFHITFHLRNFNWRGWRLYLGPSACQGHAFTQNYALGAGAWPCLGSCLLPNQTCMDPSVWSTQNGSSGSSFLGFP